MRDDIFPGPGAMPIRKGDRVVGALSTGGGLGPWTEIPGVDPSELMVDGAPANAEDMIIAHVLAAGGGLPITRDGDVVGAIGVSGAGNDETNEEIARGAIQAT